MHKYYKDNSASLKKRYFGMLKNSERKIEDIFQKSYEEAFDEIWEVYYSSFLEKMPFVGNNKVKSASNLPWALFFVALGVAGKKYGLSVQEWGKLTTTTIEKYIENIPKFVKSTANTLLRKYPRLVLKYLKYSARKNVANANHNAGSFEFRVLEPTKEFPFIVHYTVCPINNFCRKYGYMEYLPYICNLDYTTFGAFGISLCREKTLSFGDNYCDFKVSVDVPIPDSWPPHIFDESDCLK